jgi:hypothetical protein
MSSPVPAHRRPSALPGRDHRGVLAGFLAVIIGARIGMSALKLSLVLSCLVLLATLLAAFVALSGWWRLREGRAARELAGWVAAGGWEPVPDRPWPWWGLVEHADTVTVLRAYRNRVAGLPVVTGELAFVDDALSTAVDRREGYAVFVVVTLPQPAPARAVRLRRNPVSRRLDRDEFRRRFRPVGAEQHRLDDPELRAAHVRGEIPPWTLIEDELFAFVPLTAPLRPEHLEDAARRAIRVVHLFGLAVEVGEHG